MAKNRFSANISSWLAILFRSVVLSFTIACIVFGVSDISMGARYDAGRQPATTDRIAHQNRTQAVLIAADENSGGTTTSRKASTTDKRNAERWRKLPSDEKKELRNRMDQFRNLSPQQQEQYRRRYEKLQKMTPSQRKKVDQALEKGDTLPPTEKEEIRRLFED